LHDNDQLLVEKVSKHFGGIGYGDIITISTRNLENHEGNPNIIKRVIGLPGDSIEIREDGVFRNGARLSEPYLAPGTETRIRTLAYAKVTLGEKEYYVLGDNRTVSLDSRSFGPVPQAYVIGETLFRFYPFDQFGAP
jgi:signal peptidase I